MDRFVPPFLGRRRGWIAATQLTLMFGIAAMGVMDPRSAPWALAALAAFVAFASASQDIVFDAYRTDVLRAPERESPPCSRSHYPGRHRTVQLVQLAEGRVKRREVRVERSGPPSSLAVSTGAS